MSFVDDYFGAPTQQRGITPYKTSEEARKDVAAAAPRQGSWVDDMFGAPPAPAPQPQAAPAESSSNFGRGFDVSKKQLKQTAYGTAALLGDTFGSEGLKKWGLKGYQDAEKEVQALSKESDSFTNAVQSGDIGNWLTYSAGYLAGQFTDLAVASVAGAAVGGALSGPVAPAGAATGAVTGAINKAAVQTGIRGAVSKLIDKEAASLTAKFVERGIAKEAAEKMAAEQALKSVYRGIGATTANTFLNATGELGSIYGEAVEEAARKGEEYSLGRVWLAGVAATAVDTWADSKAVKGLTDAIKGTSRPGSIAIEAFKGGLREGLTEGAQTVIERWGADKDLASKEAFKEYIDSAAVGVLGGTVAGGSAGALSKLPKGSSGEPDPNPDLTSLPDPGNTGKTRERNVPALLDQQTNQMLKDGPIMAALYQQADEDGKKVIMRAVERAGTLEQFNDALGKPLTLREATLKIQDDPAFLADAVEALTPFANTQSPSGVFKATKAKPEPEDQYLDQLFQEGGFTLREKPAGAAPAPTAPAREQPRSETRVVEEEAQPAGPQGDQRNELISKFNQIGQQIFEAADSPVMQARYDWAIKQLVGSGFTTPEARAILVGDLGPEKVEAPANQTAVTELGGQGALDEAAANAEQQADAAATAPTVETPKPPAVEQAADEGLPKDIRGVKLTEKNRVQLDAYFTQEIEDTQKKTDGKTKAKRLEQLESQALKVGFTQAEVDQMFGRQQEASPASRRMTKDGRAITFETAPAPTAFSNLVRGEFGAPQALIARDSSGREVGRLTYMPNGGPIDVKVDEDLRRLGIGTALYDEFESRGGKLPDAESGVAISDEARALRKARESNRSAPAAKPPAADQANQKLKDAIADLGDVLGDAFGARMNITGQKYTVADLPKALAKVMSALIEAGVKNFQEASAKLMERMRANKDWAPLADKVDQGMLLKAWNAAGGKTATAAAPAKNADPASTIRSQTRATKGKNSGEILITNQNPINARQFYMSPEEVKENQRLAEDFRSGEEAPASKAQNTADDLDGATMRRVYEESGGGKKKGPAGQIMRRAINDAQRLLSGRMAEVDGQRVRLSKSMADGLGWGVFDVKLLDDSNGKGAEKLREIREALNRDLRALEKAEKRPKKPTETRVQLTLGVSVPQPRAAEPEPIRRLRKSIERRVREITNAAFFEDSIRKLQAQLTEIDEKLRSLDSMEVQEGGDTRKYRVRREDDANPGLWGSQDENAYDRLEGGMVYDKASPKNELLDRRRKIMNDLQDARSGSLRGQAALYRAGMDRISDYIIRRSEAAMAGGADPDMVRAAVRPYMDAVASLRQLQVRQQDQEQGIDRELEEANRNLEQADFLEGERVAMGLLSDFRSKRISQQELETLEQRGLRDGDFTLNDLLNAYQAMGVSPQQRLYAAMKHFSTRINLKDFVSQNGGSVSAVDSYFLDMAQARDLMGLQEFERRYPQRTRDLLDLWQRERRAVLARRHVTKDMRESTDPRRAFDGFLFTRITLEEARNPDLIRDTTLRQTYKGLFDNLEEAWFSDVAAALRLRPDLSNAMFNPEPVIRYGDDGKATDATARDAVISPQERQAFQSWIDRLKAGIQKQAQVMARSPFFAALRNDGLLNAVTTPEGSPMVASTPALDLDQTGMSADLEAQEGRDVRRSEYEDLYVKVVNDELEAVREVLEMNTRLKAIRSGAVDPETGEIISPSTYDELAADALGSVLMNAQMGSVYDAKGREFKQYGASIDGDNRVVRTIEEAAERDAQAGGQSSASLEDLSSAEQIQDGVISEFELETQELADQDSEAETGRGADEGPAAEAEQQSGKRGSRIPSSLVPGQEYRFRRGKAWEVHTAAVVQDIVNRLTANWRNATNVIVLPNAQHLPEPLRARVLEKLAGNGAKGLYHEGNVYLFSQHLEGEADIEFTLYHEAYGHLGMRAVLGEKFDSFLETAYRTRPEVRQAADDLIADGTPKLEAIDEVLSDMAADNRNIPIVKQWIGKMISLLRENGFSTVADWMATLTDAEVAMTLKAAREAAQRGAQPMFNGAPSEIRFKEQRVPYEVFAARQGVTRGYARYNPATDSWAVFQATGDDIRDGHTGMVVQTFEEVQEALRSRGKLEYRMRSGLYVDDKIVADLVRMPKFNEATGWAKWRRIAQMQLQNEYLPVFELVDYLASKGRITGNIDAKTALTLYERRTGAKIEDFRNNFVKPIMTLVETLGKMGVSQADIDTYLTARHAEERNLAVSKINLEMKDGGSGLTYDQAKEILNKWAGTPAGRLMEKIGSYTDRMGMDKINYLVQTGMITRKAAEKLLQYDHYVNLSGVVGTNEEFDDPGALAGGSKFNVKGTERRAFGRGEGNLAPDVLSRTLQSFEAAIIRGQKNLVTQKILGLLETNYDPDFAIINAQPRIKRLNPETGYVEEVIDENYLARKDVMMAKVNGIPITIEFKDTSAGSFAEAIHGYVSPKGSGPITETLGKVNRFFGAMLTTYNPAWIAVNFIRDIQTMYFNSASDGRITKKMARDMVKQLVPAIRVAMYVAFNKRLDIGFDPEMMRAYNEMRAAGGLTSFANRNSLEERVDEVAWILGGRKFKDSPAKKIQSWLSFMEVLTLPMEIAPRLAAYKVVRDNGFSQQKAAVYSGEVTVNFNMRGANKQMRDLYLFFNPAVQGSAKLFQLARNNPGKVTAIAGGLMAMGFLANMVGRAVSGDDEDGINRLDKVPTYKRATSIVLSADTPAAAIPLPYGWNAFYAAGHFMYDYVMGHQPLSVTLKRIGKTAFEAFSPLGGAGLESKTAEGTVLKAVAPTALLPVAEYALNENRFGAPIYKGKNVFDDADMPDAQKYFRGVSPISRAVTDGLTSLTDGNKYKAGYIDINPATIDFMIRSYLPGLGSEAYNTASLAVRAATGEKIRHAPWPLLDRLSARIPQGYDAGAYRRASEYIETLYKEYDNVRDPERRREIRAEVPRLGYAHAQIATTKRQLADVRRQIADLDQRPMDADTKMERRNRLLDREQEIFQRATKRLLEAGPEVREKMLANE